MQFLVLDFIGGPAGLIQVIEMALQLKFFTFLIEGGWITLLRSIGFFIDGKLIYFIDKGFEYFELIVSRDLLVPGLIDNLTSNVYFFIALFLLFKLSVRLIKYIIDPDLTSDVKKGANALVKRTIIGMILIIAIPMIFSTIRRFQTAIIKDDVINKVIMDVPTQIQYQELKSRVPMGRVVGFSVLQGFLNYDDSKFGAILYKKEWKTAKSNYDPSSIHINAGSSGYISNYYYDYFPIISTIALGYVFYLILKNCFDILIRFFKLSILQIISPIIMVDYILDGGEDGAFKNWLTTVASTFVMLFIRILALSFIIMVCMQMQLTQQQCIDRYVNTEESAVEQESDRIACENSILYMDNEGNVDNLLRAGIIIALLAFSFDLPKLFSSIFGLDLEQESSVTGMIGKIGGIGKMVGLGGISFAGGLLGGAIGGAKGVVSTVSNKKAQNKAFDKRTALLEQQKKDNVIDEATYNEQMAKIAEERYRSNYRTVEQMSAVTKGMAFGGMLAAANRTEVGSAAVGGYQSAKQTTANASGVKDSQSFYGGVVDANEMKDKLIDEAKQQDKTIRKTQTDELTLEELQNLNLKVGYNPSIDSVGVAAKADALSHLGQYPSGDTLLGKIDESNQSVEAIRETTVDIRDNTNVIQSNTSDMVTQLDGIQDNTYDVSNRIVTANVETEHVINNTDNVVVNNSEKIDENSSVFANMSEETFTDYQVKHHVDESSFTEKLTADNSVMKSNSDDVMDIYQKGLGVDEKKLREKENATRDN